MDEQEKKDLRKRVKIATRRWRSKVKTDHMQSECALSVKMPFKSPATFGKAKRRVERSLPTSPSKKAAVLKKI